MNENSTIINSWSQMPFLALNSQFDELLTFPENDYDETNFENFIHAENEDCDIADFLIETNDDQDDSNHRTLVPATYSWTKFLKEFASSKKYEQRIEDLYAFGDSNACERDNTGYFVGAEEILHKYFEYSHLILNEENKPRYAPTTIRMW